MPSIFSFLKGTLTGGEVTTLLQLDYDKSAIDSQTSEDISAIKLQISKQTTPRMKIKSDLSAEIPLIGIGGAGIRILTELVDRLEEYDISYPTLAIDTDKANLESFANLQNKLHVDGSDFGSSHQFRKAATRAENNKEKIKTAIENYLRNMKMSYSHEIVFLVLGSGGTGVGVGIEVAKLLIEMGKRPVPFIMLPARSEMTRIKFNAAAALYHFMYAPKDRCMNLTTIAIDNELFLTKNSKKHYSSVVASSNERIAATLGDLLISATLESDGYAANLNEFLDVFRNLKGLGFLQYLHVDSPSIELSDIYQRHFENTVSLDVGINSATRGYLLVSAPIERVLANEYRKLMQNFQNSDVFDKLYEVESEDEYYSLRGVFTGVPIPYYIEELMQLAEDARVEVLNKEIDKIDKGTKNHKIDQLTGDDEIEVKTAAERAAGSS